MKSKTCLKCGASKLLDEFQTCRSGVLGKSSYCKPCDKVYKADYYQKNKERYREKDRKYREDNPEVIRSRKLQYTYGIDLSDYNVMLVEQASGCAICGSEENIGGRRLAVDHCHTTGRNRRLLCGNCNTALGLLHENPDLMRVLALYVEHEAGND